MGVGEALVSTLEEGGAPSVVDYCKIAPPRCRMGPISDEERRQVMARSPVAGKYDTPQDRESAYETLKKRAEDIARKKAEAEARLAQEKQREAEQKAKSRKKGRSRQTVWETAGKSIARSLGTKVVNMLWKALTGRRR